MDTLESLAWIVDSLCNACCDIPSIEIDFIASINGKELMRRKTGRGFFDE